MASWVCGVWPGCCKGNYFGKDPVLGLKLCYSHLEIHNNVIFEFMFCMWSPLGQQSMNMSIGAARWQLCRSRPEGTAGSTEGKQRARQQGTHMHASAVWDAIRPQCGQAGAGLRLAVAKAAAVWHGVASHASKDSAMVRATCLSVSGAHLQRIYTNIKSLA